MGKIRVDITNPNSRDLIQMADVRDFQEQMREISARLGSCILKVGQSPQKDESTAA